LEPVSTSPASPLRNRDFRLLAGSIGVSALGDWLAAIPLILLVERMTGSGLAVSALLICLWAPSVLLAGHVGLLVDRFETTRLLAVVSAAQAGVATGLAFTEELSLVLLLTGLLGVGFAVSQAAEFALVPAVAAGSSLQQANGYVETSRYAGFVIGPLVGGVLAGAGGTSLAMLVNAASFVVVAAAVLALRTRRHPEPHEDGAERVRARDGVVQLFRDRVLGLAMTVAFVSLLFMSASIPADVFFVKDVLGMGDGAFGLVYAGWTIGMILGALVISKRVPVAMLAAVGFVAVAVQGAGKALTTLWLVFGFMLVCYFVGGVGHGVKNVMFRTLIHERVPARMHGRAFAAYNGIRNAAELGALALGGVLVAALGARWTLLLAGGISAVAGLLGLAALPRVAERRSVEEPPAAAAV
jgi:Na+/melibiose symporter-like transporter